jgi:hypothetical protein
MMRGLLCSILSFVLAMGLVDLVRAETGAVSAEERITLLIECDWCDRSYLRQEIDYVDHVRDRQEAQVHVIASAQHMGGGGRRYTVSFEGREEFAGLGDTLQVSVYQDDSRDESRDKLKQIIELGLVRYIARTRLADRYELKLATDEDGKVATATEDPWDSWVFSISANGYRNGSKNYNSSNLWSSLSAKRITEDWKFNASGSFNCSESVFDLSEGEEKSVSRSRHAYLRLVKSLGEHWSAGAMAMATTSLFDNYDSAINAYPAVEYNFFPYSESARRSLTMSYRIGVGIFDYDQETIYDKLEETLWRESLEIDLDLVRDWGSVNLSLEGRHYLHDFDLNRLDANGSLNLKLIKGLSMNFWGRYSAIHDQLNLNKSGASDEDILLQRRALESQYSYSMSVGLSYSFGSIYNNVVNPRF